ncbi:hypothetical protein [Dyadobacter crusticola]|uniref:hypothetical protein n=1 Tax=Dyadobacter crusticola TaxID=292407 RepID=UPI0004E0D4A5|nr:hypothetical protein [Dyadobacter crusticola]
MKHLLSILFLSTLAISSYAQSTTPGDEPRYEVAVLAGLLQPTMLQGGNVEVDFYTRKMVFNYSHGFSLDLDAAHGTTVGEVKRQNLAIHLPYSTGFGIGYRINRFFDIRFEPKLHDFDVYYEGSTRQSGKVADYRTVTLGLGAYFRWKPFEKQQNVLKGIFTSTSARYWQNVWSSLDNNEIVYTNQFTKTQETHKASNIGIANTPFIFNIAVGYSFIIK